MIKKLLRKYQDALPSPKVQMLIAGILLLVAGYGIYRLVTYLITPKTEKNIIVSLVDELDRTERETLAVDSDNDGAYDWEEALWGLNPNDPDTDGDGILDGEYIDVQNSLQERERLGELFVESNLTETEKLGRSLFMALLTVQQTSDGLDEQTNEQISGNISDYITNLNFADNIYTRDRLFLVEDTKENSYAYRDAMKKILKEYPIATSDIELIIKATEKPKEFQAELRARHLKYRAYLEKLVALNVPYAIASEHTRLVNVVGQIEAALFNLTEDEQDDLVTLASIVQLENIMNQVTETLTTINTYFTLVEETKSFEKPLPEEN
jgi:hypothetical protein